MAEPVETSDVTIRLALALVGVAVAMIAGSALLVAWIAPESLRPRHLALPAVPKPVLQIHPRDDLARFRAGEQADLSSYGWVDRGKGVVRIPVGQAMEKVVKDGIPGWPAETR